MLDGAQTACETELPHDAIEQFQDALLCWFSRHKRDLPWRRANDPYAIWVSEVMLQQTRVAAVIPYYERFLQRFPTFEELAVAPEADLLAHWAGLGYYYRARNLQKAAQVIQELGRFPASHADIRALPGIGDYTSAAVASIAYQLPHAAVDGNVLRVLSRISADGSDINSAKGRKRFARLAAALLPQQRPGDFNQAMMELGALVCLPKNPQCLVCPVSRLCRARQQGRQQEFPVKLGRAKSVPEHRLLFWIERSSELLLWQRPAHSRLMPGFWELPEKHQLPSCIPGRQLGSFRHGITFHNYRFDVHAAEPPDGIGLCQWIPLSSLSAIPVSTVVRKARRAVTRMTLRASAGD